MCGSVRRPALWLSCAWLCELRAVLIRKQLEKPRGLICAGNLVLLPAAGAERYSLQVYTFTSVVMFGVILMTEAWSWVGCGCAVLESALAALHVL